MLGIGALELERGPMADRGQPGPGRDGRASRATSDEASALFDAYGDRIRRYIAFRVRSADDADDLTSEVSRRFVSGPVPVEAAARPAWLFRVAHNAIIDHYRRRRFTVPLGSLLDRPDDTPGLPERAIRDERMAEPSTGLWSRSAVDSAPRSTCASTRTSITPRSRRSWISPR
jgi:DNA-directed RNA polymerase specialized sigma24 family protein